MAADDPGTRPDATGRRLAYLPAALLGNGALLVTLSARGEVERMLWPHVDGPSNVRELRLGVRHGAGVRWLDEGPGAWSQEWEGSASILRTTVAADDVDATVLDVVDPDEPVLVRRVETDPGTLVVSLAPALDGLDVLTGGFVDPASKVVVVHGRRAALAVGVEGRDVAAEVGSAGARGDDVAHVAPLWARLTSTHAGVAHVVAALAATPFDALETAKRHLATAGDARLRRRRADELLLVRAVAAAGDSALDRLVRRSVLVLEQLADRASGGIVAAPEMDERFAESGGYGFVWPRDLSYVVLGLLAAGRGDAASAALRWLARTQAPEGLWLQRYWTNGHPAPSWGLHQIDETGAALLAIEAAVGELEDEGLDAALWPVVRRAAELLVRFVEPGSGLPMASVDLWEQHDGQHAYSAAAVVGGLRCASFAARRHEPVLAVRYADAAASVATAVDAHLWDAGLGRYCRGVNVAGVGGRAAPPASAFDRGLPYPERRVAKVARADTRLDSSLLGLAWPFAPFGADHDRVRATVQAVADGLTTPAGGLRRHEGDSYAGGREWPLATLWLGLARRALGEAAALDRAVDHVVRRRTPLDLLPEQVFEDGRPAWVLPLGWSHAMLLVAAQPELRVVERLREKVTGDGRGG